MSLTFLPVYVMAKELPFFKFESGSWENGKIQVCSFEVQGVFINVCSMYWQRLGDLSYKLALQKACKGNADALRTLSDEGILKVIDGMICIDFLNEQLAEFENTSKTNSEAAHIRWQKHRENAAALRTQSEGNAIRGEERREDERREEKTNAVAIKIASKTIEERAKDFYNSLKPFTDSFSKEILRAFYEYWIERSPNGKKMRFEKEKVFDPARRLATWKSNEQNKFNATKISTSGTFRTTDAIIEQGKDFGIKTGF